MQPPFRSLRTLGLALALPLAAAAAHAQTTIDQATALAGGITPADAAGFPVTIDQPVNSMVSFNEMRGIAADGAAGSTVRGSELVGNGAGATSGSVLSLGGNSSGAAAF